jgi:hypothetical protein
MTDCIKLYTHNLDVDSINFKKYNHLSKSEIEKSFEMTESGKANLVENLKSSCLAPEILNLKIGTKVIFIKNDKFGKYQNGTLGEVAGFENGNDFGEVPIVKTFSGENISVEKES